MRHDVLNGGSTSFDGTLALAPYESCLIVAGATADVSAADAVAPGAAPDTLGIAGPWHVAHASARAYPAFGTEQQLDELADLDQEAFPGCAGTFRYRTTFTLAADRTQVTLDLGDVYETAEARVDGAALGVRIAPPYTFAVGDLPAGEHELVVEVINTVDHQMCDYFSMSEPTEPTGILGPVTLR